MKKARGPAPEALSPSDVAWESLGLDGVAEVRVMVGPDRSRTIGAGLVRFRDISFEWSLDYDEVLYILAGQVTVEHDGRTVRGSVGDVILLHSGSSVTYRFEGACEAFFATYPVDWEERSRG